MNNIITTLNSLSASNFGEDGRKTLQNCSIPAPVCPQYPQCRLDSVSYGMVEIYSALILCSVVGGLCTCHISFPDIHGINNLLAKRLRQHCSHNCLSTGTFPSLNAYVWLASSRAIRTLHLPNLLSSQRSRIVVWQGHMSSWNRRCGHSDMMTTSQPDCSRHMDATPSRSVSQSTFAGTHGIPSGRGLLICTQFCPHISKLRDRATVVQNTRLLGVGMRTPFSMASRRCSILRDPGLTASFVNLYFSWRTISITPIVDVGVC